MGEGNRADGGGDGEEVEVPRFERGGRLLSQMTVVMHLRPFRMALILGAGWFVSSLAVCAGETNAPAAAVTPPAYAPAATNDPSLWLKDLVLSPPHLRSLNSETVAALTPTVHRDDPDLDLKVLVKIAPPVPPPALVLDPGPVSVASNYRAGTGSYDSLLDRLVRTRGLIRIPNTHSDNVVVQALNNTFSPEVIHYRKADVSCTIYTAIKRKNPFCLLNPIFFNVSW